MFVVRFLKRDGDVEDYFYHHFSDALYHIHCFNDDTSNLYSSISLLFVSDTLEEVLLTLK